MLGSSSGGVGESSQAPRSANATTTADALLGAPIFHTTSSSRLFFDGLPPQVHQFNVVGLMDPNHIAGAEVKISKKRLIFQYADLFFLQLHVVQFLLGATLSRFDMEPNLRRKLVLQMTTGEQKYFLVSVSSLCILRFYVSRFNVLAWSLRAAHAPGQGRNPSGRVKSLKMFYYFVQNQNNKIFQDCGGGSPATPHPNGAVIPLSLLSLSAAFSLSPPSLGTYSVEFLFCFYLVEFLFCFCVTLTRS